MALWPVSAVLIEKETFDLFIVGGIDVNYTETATAASTATGSLTDSFYSPVDTAVISSIASASLVESYSSPVTDVRFKVGQVALGGLSGTQDFEIPGFGTPKAAIFILSGATEKDVATPDAVFSIGWCDGTGQAVTGITARDNQTDSLTFTGRQPFKSYKDNACVAVNSATPDFSEVLFSFGSFSQDKVTLIRDDHIAVGSGYLCTFILIGGTDVVGTHIGFHDDVGNGPFPSPINVDTIGFEPSMAFFASPNEDDETAGVPGESFGTDLSLGVWINDGADTQKSVGLSIPRPNYYNSTSFATSYNSSVAAISGVNTIPAFFPELAVSGANANGFVLDTPASKSAVSVHNQIPFYFCLKFANNPKLALFDVTLPEAISYGSYEEVAPGFYPDFGMLFTNAVGSPDHISLPTQSGIFNLTVFDEKVLSSTTYTAKANVLTSGHKSFVSDSLSVLTVDGGYDVNTVTDALPYNISRVLTADGWTFTPNYFPAVGPRGFGLAIGIDALPVYKETAETTAVCSFNVGSILPATGGVVAPLPAIQATIAIPTIGTVVAPLPIVSGELLGVITGVGVCFNPLPEVVGLGKTGTVSVGTVQAPMPTLQIAYGFGANVQPSLPIVSGTGLTGQVGRGTTTTSLPQVLGQIEQTALISANVQGALPIVSGTLAQGVVYGGVVQPRISSVNGTGLTGAVGIGSVVLPPVVVSSPVLSEVISTGNIQVSLPFVQAMGFGPVSAFVIWTMNTKNSRVTNYTDFPFIALGKMGSDSMGAAADGIYVLDGADDAGQSIDSIFRFGMVDFRAELTNVTDAYVGGDMEGDMEMGILEDGQDVENLYSLAERERHVRGHHAKLGKGFRSRYRQLSINNVNGSDFVLDSLTLPPRDLKGNE